MYNKQGVLLVSLLALFAVGAARADIASTAYVQSLDVSTFDNDAGYLVSADVSNVVDAVNSVVDTQDPDSLVNRVTDVETALGASGSANAGKAVIAGSSLGTPTYRAIDTTAGGTTGSDSLITSGAVYSGLAGKQATIDSSHKLSKDLVSGLGTAAAASTSDFATSAQGGKADSAIQSVKVNGTALTPDGNKAVDITVPAAQVNSDWNASSGKAQILNKPTNVSAFNNDAGYLVESDLDEILDIDDDNSLISRVTSVETALGESGSSNAGKAIVAGGTALGTPTYRVIDTTAGGTTGSDSLITSGAVYSGLAGKQATIDSSHKLSKDLVSGLGTAAAASTSDFATSAQGGKADSAIQSVKVNGTALTPDTNKAVDITVPAAQVNSDWNASSGKAQILNKPTNVSAFNNDAGYLTAHQTLPTVNTSSGSGNVVTNVTQTDGTIAVTKGRVQIPVGAEDASTYAAIWVE